MISIKSLAESPNLNSIPSNYTFTNNEQYLLEDDTEVKIPTIDFSLLTSGNPDQRSKAIYELGKACEDWGFFTVINHGVPEWLMGAVIDGCRGFFELSEEDKEEFKANHVLDPIRYGTSFNASVEEVFFWRDYLKVFVHPQFHFPNKPSGFSQISQDYCKRTQEVARKVLEGISESLGLEANYIDKALNLKSGFQLFAANFYPPCPQPELAMGMPPHSDHGLLTILTQNGIGGLQIQHNEMWVNVNALPNSFLVNTGDHLQLDHLIMVRGGGNSNNKNGGASNNNNGGNHFANLEVEDRSCMDDSSSPFYLSNGDHLGMNMVSSSLTGRNYNSWSRAMTMALVAKNKFCFVDDFKQWEIQECYTSGCCE